MDDDFPLQDWVIVNETDCGDDVFFENSASPLLAVDSDQESDGSISIISYPPTDSPSEEEHESAIEHHQDELPCVATSSSQTYILKSLDKTKAIHVPAANEAHETPEDNDDFKLDGASSSLHRPPICNELTLHKEIDYHEELISHQKPTLDMVSAQDEESIIHIEFNSKEKNNSMAIQDPILSEDVLLAPYKPPIFYGSTVLDKETDSAGKFISCENAEIAQIKFSQDDESTFNEKAMAFNKSTSDPVICEELFSGEISLLDEELISSEETIQHAGSFVADKTIPHLKVESGEEVISSKGPSSITMKSNSEKFIWSKQSTATKQSQSTLKEELIQQRNSAPDEGLHQGFFLEPYEFTSFSSIPNSEFSPAFEESAGGPVVDEMPIVYYHYDHTPSKESVQDEIEIPDEDPTATKKLLPHNTSNTYQDDSSKKGGPFLFKDSDVITNEIFVIPRGESIAPMDLISNKTTTSDQLEELILDANSLFYQQPNDDLFIQEKIIPQEKSILKQQSTSQAGSLPDEISNAKPKASNASKYSLTDETSSQESINLDHGFQTAIHSRKRSSTENHDNVIPRTSITQLGKDKTLAKISIVLMSTVCVISCCMYAYTLQSDTKLSRCLLALSPSYYRVKDKINPQERINSGLEKHNRHKEIHGPEDGFARNSRGSYFLGLKHNIKSVFDTQNKYDLSRFKCHKSKMRKTNRNKSKKKNIRPVQLELYHFDINYRTKEPHRKIRHFPRRK